MNTVRTLLPALGAGFLFTLGGPGQKLVFEPRAGSSVSKTFESEFDFALDELSLIVSGQDVGGMIEQVEVSIQHASRIEVTDTYKAVAHGRPLDLLRTFEELSGTLTMDVSPAQASIPEMVSSSELEGMTVAFHWNEENGEYERSFPDADADADEELLEGLEEDMDLRVFLPSSEVSEGDEWTVDLTKLGNFAMPGGDLQLRPEGIETDDEGLEMFEEFLEGFGDELDEMFEGECKCTYKGTHDEDGVSVGEIFIDVEVSATLDLSRFLEAAIQKAIAENGVGEMVDFSLDSADLNVDFEGSGTFLWNLAAGRMHSFQLGGDATIGIDLVMGIEAQGESQSIDASLELSGSIRQGVTAKE